ncbi:protein of unknown function [Clostridium beijerinckii]|nr:protein of unknown function [Clostridium beijerinckii]
MFLLSVDYCISLGYILFIYNKDFNLGIKKYFSHQIKVRIHIINEINIML